MHNEREDMSREAFEAWAQIDDNFTVYRSTILGRDYVSDLTNAAWRAWQAAQADAYERAAKVCETAGVPIDIDAWMGTKKALTAATATGLADAIRALAKEVT